MSNQVRLFIGVAAVTAAVIIAVALIAGGGGEKKQPSAAVLVVTATPLPTTQAPAATSAAPTSVPPTQAAPTAVPPTQAPPPTPVPPTPEPAIRTCAEIRASGTYVSEAERQFFLQNCVGQAQPAPTARPGAAPAPTQAAAPGAGPSQDEDTYIRRASAVNLQYVARLQQYWETPSYGAEADLYELASIALNHANALNAIQPVPSRFVGVHNALVSSLLRFRDHILTITSVSSLSQFLTWSATYDRLADDLDTALVNWQTTVGVPVVSLGGLR